MSLQSYSLLDLKWINFKGEELLLVKLRNPFGTYEWEGDWSDKSPLWTPEYIKQCNFVN